MRRARKADSRRRAISSSESFSCGSFGIREAYGKTAQNATTAETSRCPSGRERLDHPWRRDDPRETCRLYRDRVGEARSSNGTVRLAWIRAGYVYRPHHHVENGRDVPYKNAKRFRSIKAPRGSMVQVVFYSGQDRPTKGRQEQCRPRQLGTEQIRLSHRVSNPTKVGCT